MSQEDISQICQRLDSIEKKLDPIYDAYRVSTTVGKWTKGLFAFVSIVIGIALGLRSLFK